MRIINSYARFYAQAVVTESAKVVANGSKASAKAVVGVPSKVTVKVSEVKAVREAKAFADECNKAQGAVK